jgi:type VI secretion system lysozyme-like protein
VGLFDNFSSTSAASGENQIHKNIIENLNNVLNTKKNYGSFLEGYGIRDLNEYSSRDKLATAIMDEVTYNIEQYEPRLQLVNIVLEKNDDPFRISFKIECMLKETTQSLFMEFDSVFNSFRVKKL